VNFIVLAAGVGSRMGTLSTYLQKCMYPVLEKPFLEYTLQSVIASGRFDPTRDALVLVVGHKADQIRSYFGDLWQHIPLRYVEQTPPLGTAHALLLGRDRGNPEEACVVVQADVWADPGFFAALVDHPAANVLSSVRHVCERQHNERLDLDGDRVVRAWQGTGPYVECGIWKFSPELTGRMMSRKADEYRALISVQAAIDEGMEVKVLERDDWVHLGGTEPSVRENLAALYRFVLERGAPW